MSKKQSDAAPVVPRKKLRASPAKQGEPGTVISTSASEWRRQLRRHERAASDWAVDQWMGTPLSYLRGLMPMEYIDPLEALDPAKPDQTGPSEEELDAQELEFEKRCAALEHARKAMLFIADPPEVDRWLCTPKAELGGASPIDAIRDGKALAVIEMLGHIIGADDESVE